MILTRKNTPIPEAIVQLQRQLEQFRSTHPRRTKLPESLWQIAVELARQHGLYSVAHPLRLDYVGLKRRIEGAPSPRRRSRKPAFVELIPSPVSKLECVIEFESPSGSKMRIRWEAPTASDWANLLRAWRDAER